MVVPLAESLLLAVVLMIGNDDFPEPTVVITDLVCWDAICEDCTDDIGVFACFFISDICVNLAHVYNGRNGLVIQLFYFDHTVSV